MSEQVNPTAAEGGNPTPATGERTFTQEDVNRIVQERLAKEKGKNDATLTDRERDLEHREFLLEAREMLATKGLPADLLDALNTSSKEAFEKSLSIIEEKMKGSSTAKKDKDTTPARVVSTGFRFSEPGGIDSDPIRDAMGLNKG